MNRSIAAMVPALTALRWVSPPRLDRGVIRQFRPRGEGGHATG